MKVAETESSRKSYYAGEIVRKSDILRKKKAILAIVYHFKSGHW